MNTGINSEPSTERATLNNQSDLHERADVPHPRKASRSLQYDQSKRVSGETAASKSLRLLSTFERHYSVKELAELWNLSDRTVRRMFVHEPGVLEWGTGETRMKRGYKTLRIPESVAQRVYGKLRRAS